MIAPKNRRLLPFLIFFFSSFLLQSQIYKPLVATENRWFDVPQFADVLADTSFSLTVDSFLQQPKRYVFKPNNEKQILGAPQAVYWLRFMIQNDDSFPTHRFVVVNKKEIDTIRLFLTRDNRVEATLLSGACVPYTQRAYPNPSFWLPVTLKPKTTYTVYVLLDSRYDFLSTTIRYQTEHLGDILTEERRRSFVAGIAFFYLLFALTLFAYIRRRLFFYYTIYVTGGVGYLLSTTGFGITMIWPNAPQFDVISANVMGNVSILGFIFMSRLFLETPIYFKKSDALLRGGLWVCAAVILTAFLKKSFNTPVYFQTCMVGVVAFVIVLATILYVSIVSYRRFRRREVGLFLLSFSSYLMVSLLSIASELGILKYQNLFFQSLFEALPQVAFFFEMTVLSIIMSFRIRKEMTEQQLKTIAFQQKIIDQRERISRDLHDDIGSTLNSISVYSEIARRQIQRTNPQSESILVNIGESARQLVDSMNDIVWAINPQNDQFGNITQRMRLFAAQIMMSQNIALHFEADTRLNDVLLSIEKRKNFYLIFKEAVNNIYKYAHCKTLTIKIQQENGSIHMQIADDGCGFDTQAVHNGNGMKTMRHRVEELNGTLSITSAMGNGTLLTLRFPVAE